MENRLLLTLTLTGPERDRVLSALERPRVYRFPFSVTTESGERFNCKELTMYDLKVNRKVHVVFGMPVDELGNKAKVDGVPTVEALNPDIAVFEPGAADGFDGWVNPVRSRPIDDNPANNVASFKLKVDADLTSGVRHIEEVFSVNIVSGEAVDILGVNFGQEAPNLVVTPPPPPPAPLADTFATRADFDAAVAAYEGPEAVMLDGVEVKAGTTPALEYFTQGDSSVGKTAPPPPPVEPPIEPPVEPPVEEPPVPPAA